MNEARAGMPARALVCAGAVETEYLRAGCGAPVLLLLHGRATDWWNEDPAPESARRAFELLSARYRVIAPTIPAGVGFATWLGDFLDGLGVDRPSVVAEPGLALAAQLFAIEQPGRVHCVAVLYDGEGAADDVIRSLSGADGASS
jgi:pimeloyl-ACP methyl ester carboxylesterase